MRELFWLDLEMSGLDREKDRILEVAAVVTDHRLEPIAEYEAVVYQPPEVLEGMGPWCQKTHAENGLIERVPSGKPIETVEAELIAFARARCRHEQLVLAGNSIYTDREFVQRGMPRFTELLHYRMLDVTAFKIAYFGMFGITFRKAEAHRARDDIRESIAELKYYLSLVSPPAAADAGDAGS